MSVTGGRARGGVPGGGTDTWVEVHHILSRYLVAVDSGDFDHVADVLAQATISSPGGTISGWQEIRQFYEEHQPVPHPDGRRRTKHYLTNLTVTAPDTLGEVLAEAYYFVLEAGPDGPRVIKSGRFREQLTRTSAGWSIREHQILPDF